MQNRLILGCTLTLVLATPLGASAAPLGAKPGAWETTSTTTRSGMPKRQRQRQMPTMSKEQLARLTPEQRAMIENMSVKQDGNTTSVTMKHCVKATDSTDQMMSGPQRHNCTKKIISQSASRIELEMTCPKPHATKTHVVVVAQSAESHTMTMDMQGEGGMKMHTEAKSHWVGSSCEGIPDYSQMGKRRSRQ